MPTTTTLASDVQAAIGGRHDPHNNRVVFAAFYGYLSAVTLPTADTPAHLQRLGAGYQNPEDVLLARKPGTGEDVIYLSDRSGSILEIHPDVGYSRAEATVLASALTAPQQMALSNDGQALYVVEYSPPGAAPARLLRIPLIASAPSTILADVRGGVGVVVGPAVAGIDQIYLVEQDPGTLTQVDAATGTRTAVLAADLPNPFFATWRDPARLRLLVALRDPHNAIVQVDLGATDAQGRPKVSQLVDGLPWRPSSAVSVAGTLVVLADQEIALVDLGGGPTATESRGPGGGGQFNRPRVDPTDPAHLVMSSDMGELYRSTDSGTSWTMLDTQEVTGYARFSAAIRPGSHGGVVAAHAVRGLRLGTPSSTDPSGMSWTTMSPQPAAGFHIYDPTRPCAAAFSPDGTVLLLGLGTAGLHRWDFTATPPPSLWPAPNQPRRSGHPEDVVEITWANADTAVAATTEGVYWSPDRGAGWYPLEPATSALPPTPGGAAGDYDAGTSRVQDLAAGTAPAGTQTPQGTVVIWATTPAPDSGLYRCLLPPGHSPTDPAPAWERIAAQIDITPVWAAAGPQAQPPAAGSVHFQHLAASSTDPDTVHVSVAYDGAIPRPSWNVLTGRRTGAGQTWTGSFDGYQRPDQQPWRDLSPADAGWIEPPRPTGLDFGFSGSANALAVDPTGQNLYYTSMAGVYTGTVSTPARWRQLYTRPVQTGQGVRWRTNGADDTTVWRYVISPSDPRRHLLANTDIGLTGSDDGGDTWQLLESAHNTTYDIALHPGGTYTAVSSQHDLGHTGGWERPLGTGAVLHSADGTTWTELQTWATNPVTSLRIAPTTSPTPGLLFAALFGAGVASFDGHTWTTLPKTGLPDGQLPPSPLPENWSWNAWQPGRSALYVYQVDVDAAGRLLCLVTRNTRNDGTGAGLYRYTPAAGTWTPLSEPVAARYTKPNGDTDPTLFHPVSFTPHPVDPDRVWLCVSAIRGTHGPGAGYLGTVPDGSAPTWTRMLDYGMLGPSVSSPAYAEHLSVFSIAYDPDDPAAETVYAATATHGVLTTGNASAITPTWNQVPNVPFRSTQRVAFDSSDPDALYVTTFGGGAWRTVKPATVQRLRQTVRRAAYQQYENRSRTPGHDLTDWLAAEQATLDPIIRERAYQLYLRRGATHSTSVTDWLQAEQQIRCAVRG